MYALLALINLLTIKARGSRRVARGIAYVPGDHHKLDIYAPIEGNGPWPVVYFLYGGAWRMGSRGYYEFAARALAAAGFVVVVPDYSALPAVEYPAFIEDCAAGLRWVPGAIGRYGGDPHRLVLLGHSAGAYNAVMLALDPRYGVIGRARAVVGLSGPYDFYPFAVPITLRTFGAADDPRGTQPIPLVTEAAPTMFLGHGSRDTLVGAHNTINLAAALRSAGVAVVERHYDTLDHPGTLLALGGPAKGKAPVLTEVISFLKQTLAR